MKISFSNVEKRQPAVSELQEEMRDMKPVRFRIFRSLLILLILAIVAVSTYKFINRKVIYTYGVVSGQRQQAQAMATGTIVKMQVKPGDIVKKGDVIAILQPERLDDSLLVQLDRIHKLNVILTNLRRKKLELSATAKDLEANRDLRNLVDKKQETEHRIQLKQLSRRHEIKQAKKTSQRKLKRLAEITERQERVAHLLSLNAAVKADLERAKQVVETASYELDIAVQRESYLANEDAVARAAESRQLQRIEKKIEFEKSLSGRTSELEQSERLKALERVKEQIKNQEDYLKELEDEVQRRKQVESNQTIRALFDGIVGNVTLPAGNYVTLGQTILEIHSTDDVWVDAYIPTSKTFLLDKIDDVRIITEFSKHSVSANLLEREGAVVKVPPLLQDLLPKYKTVKYLRLQLDDTSSVKPGSIVRVVLK